MDFIKGRPYYCFSSQIGLAFWSRHRISIWFLLGYGEVVVQDSRNTRKDCYSCSRTIQAFLLLICYPSLDRTDTIPMLREGNEEKLVVVDHLVAKLVLDLVGKLLNFTTDLNSTADRNSTPDQGSFHTLKFLSIPQWSLRKSHSPCFHCRLCRRWFWW